MGFRFRKSIKLFGNTKINFSHKSIGISTGVRGARLSANSKRGITGTVGIPDTGISYSKNINTHTNTSIPNTDINTHSNTSSTKINKKSKDGSNNFLSNIKNFFAWFFSIIFLIGGLGNLFIAPIYGLSIIAIGLILNPKFNKFIESKFNFYLTIKIKILLITILFILGAMGVALFNNIDNKNTSHDNVPITSIVFIVGGIYLIYTQANKSKILQQKEKIEKEIEMEIEKERIEKERIQKEIEIEIQKEKERIKMEKEMEKMRIKIEIEREIEREREREKIKKQKQEKLDTLTVKLNNKEITQEMFNNIKERLGL